MNYQIGMKLIWIPDSKLDAREGVTVAELRSRGQARLSNGWTVDADGVAEGSRRVSGGKVVPFEDPEGRARSVSSEVLEMLKRVAAAEFDYGEWPSREEIEEVINKATGEAS